MSDRREYQREYMRLYRERHPEKMAEYNRTQMERRRARRVVRQGVCARCGKTFEVGIGERMTKYCSHKCMKREMTLRQLAKEKAKRTREFPTPSQGKALTKRPCAFCGKEIVVYARHPNKTYCSKRCKTLSYVYPSAEEFELVQTQRQMARAQREKEQAERRAERQAAQAARKAAQAARKAEQAARPKVERRDSFGLTREQRLAVVTAQDGDRDALWAASQTWTPAQRKFAKARYEELHPTRHDFYLGNY